MGSNVRTLKCSVLVVGAGPVGMTLAMDLAWRGIDVVVAEIRPRDVPPNVKCNHVSARTMEIFRRLGVADKVRNAGLPADYPNDVAYLTTTTGIELTRIPIPCRANRFTDTSGPDGHWPTAEPPHRINQIFLEPVLLDHLLEQPDVTVLSQTEITGFMQDSDGVRAQATDLATGEVFAVTADYLVGCEGGRSPTRRTIGAQLQGDAVVQRVQSTYFRAPDLLARLPGKPAWVMFSLNPRRSGNCMAIDGRERWLIHNYLNDDEPEFDSVDRDWAIREILGVGADFQYEVLSREDWYGRRLVADRFRDRRAFICGDAAHLWVPYAGYGMNAGIADAANLAWMLAAVLKGWGGEALLDAYQAERQPITEQVSHFAMNHAAAMAKARRAVPADIEADTPHGAALRAQLGQSAYALNVTQYCCGGLNFGYFYAKSPIVVADGQDAPGYSMADFTPSTVPGCRVPHFMLDDSRSLYDALGPDFTLLRFNPAVPVEALLREAAISGLPLELLDLPANPLYPNALLIARPDQHVAWRGDALPPDVVALIEHICGAGNPGVSALVHAETQG